MHSSSQTTNRVSSYKSSRRGIASFEFVMSLPFLLFLSAYIASVGWSALKKADATMSVRNSVWKKRSNVNSRDTKPLNFGPWDQGLLDGKKQNRFRVFWQRNRNRNTTSKTAILAGTWDHKEIREFRSDGPHFDLMKKVGVGSLGKKLEDFIGGSGSPNFGSDPEIEKAREQAKAEAEAAKQKQEQANREAQERLNEEQEKLKKLKEERAQLATEYKQLREKDTQLRADRTTAQTELGELINAKKDAMLKGEPVPEGTDERISELNKEIGTLSTDIGTNSGDMIDKAQEWRDKNDEVIKQEGIVGEMEAGVQDAQQKGNKLENQKAQGGSLDDMEELK